MTKLFITYKRNRLDKHICDLLARNLITHDQSNKSVDLIIGNNLNLDLKLSNLQTSACDMDKMIALMEKEQNRIELVVYTNREGAEELKEKISETAVKHVLYRILEIMKADSDFCAIFKQDYGVQEAVEPDKEIGIEELQGTASSVVKALLNRKDTKDAYKLTELGQIVKAKRRENGLSRQDLAKRINKSVGEIILLETGLATIEDIDENTICVLSDVLGIDAFVLQILAMSDDEDGVDRELERLLENVIGENDPWFKLDDKHRSIAIYAG